MTRPTDDHSPSTPAEPSPTTSSTDPALEDALARRFLRYSAVPSQSDASATTVPSSEGQWELARLLSDELTAAGAHDVHLSDTCVLTACIPSTLPTQAPVVGFCTHLDTADSGLSPQVHAHIVEHTGGDVPLDADHDRWIRVVDHPELDKYVGQRLLVTDGTSVLGADDKAAVTSVMEAAVRVLADPELLHPEIRLAFVPDEEIGLRGVQTMDLGRFPVDHAYTLDCCEVGELIEATFNAATATITVTGVAAHPMSAYGVLVNPILVAHDIIDRLDPAQTPERTRDREGFIWVHDVTGDQSTTTLTLSIRDHDAAGFEEKKARLRDIVDGVSALHPRARIDLDIVDVYGNIEDARTEDNAVASRRLVEAMESVGVEPIRLPMRGGTDGSWLSRQGIYTPNFFTGAHNFHSACEFLPLPSLVKSHQVVMALMTATSS